MWVVGKILTFLMLVTALAAQTATKPVSGPGPVLSAEESAWLKTHPKLKLGLDPQWPPFSFTNAKGEIEGIDREYLNLIEKRLGIQFEIVKTQVWHQTEEKISLDEVDVVSGITPTAERAKNLVFTRAYVSFPTAIVTRLDGPFLTDIHSLKEKHAATPRGYITSQRLKAEFPTVFVTETETLQEALELVSRGRADFTLENLPSLSHIIRENGFTNLKISGMGEFRFDLHLGVRRDLPLLHSALQKALDSIDSKQQAKILADWVYIETRPPNPLQRYFGWFVAGAVALVLGFFGISFWNRRLAGELVERRRIEAELRRLNEEKSQFMSMAAHDINNPLTVIQMDCQLAIRKQQKLPGEEASGYEHILKHAQRISHLISDLLQPHTSPAEVPRLRPVTTILNEIVERVVSSYTHIAAQKDIVIEHVSHHKIQIWADPGSVMQVMENLISNAVKFSPHAGKVLITSRLYHERARVEVKDTGPGISREDRAHLFGWFSRLSANPTAEEPSHGLGLFIVKELMGEMNGKVWVESVLGQGATFIVEFPIPPTDGKPA